MKADKVSEATALKDKGYEKVDLTAGTTGE